MLLSGGPGQIEPGELSPCGRWICPPLWRSFWRISGSRERRSGMLIRQGGGTISRTTQREALMLIRRTMDG